MHTKVGVLAFQGAFAEHCGSLKRCWETMQFSSSSISGASYCKHLHLEVVEVRTPADMHGLRGLVIPGGESTTMGKFLEVNDFYNTIKNWMADNKNVIFGTCAGLILLSNNIKDTKEGGQQNLGGLDITCTRNQYGRQCESFERKLMLEGDIGEGVDKESEEKRAHSRGVFIRAPGIYSVDSNDVNVLASYYDGKQKRIAAVEQKNILVTSFHPELTDDLTWHRYFINKIVTSCHQ